PEEIQIATVRASARRLNSETAPVLINSFKSSPPRIQGEILDAFFSRKEWIGDLLSALENQTIPMTAITPVRRKPLLSDPDEKVRNRSAMLFGKTRSQSRE